MHKSSSASTQPFAFPECISAILNKNFLTRTHTSQKYAHAHSMPEQPASNATRKPGGNDFTVDRLHVQTDQKPHNCTNEMESTFVGNLLR